MLKLLQSIYPRKLSRTIIIFHLLAISQLHGAVWEDKQFWDRKWEQRYQQWIVSEKVHPRIFVGATSPYRGLVLDCADAAYALRAIFAFENSLPFAIHSPTGSRTGDSEYLTNRTTGFDHLGAKTQRLVAFLNYIGASVGTENLTRLDTFSPQIASLGAGDLFTYKIAKTSGNTVRHTYIIKEINPQGTFDVIYSTQAIARNRLPLLWKEHYQLTNRPHNPWGFRRFKWPHLLSVSMEDYPEELAPSLEQYQLAGQLGERGFFRYVQQRLAQQSETPEMRLQRLLKAVCLETQGRIEVVNLAVKYVQQVGGRCLNYQEFDTHSTPSRDQQLQKMFEILEEDYRQLELAGNLNLLSWQQRQWMGNLLSNSGETDNSLITMCPINYSNGKVLSLGQVYQRLKRQQMSTHPNDLREIRWGDQGGRTTCPSWY